MTNLWNSEAFRQSLEIDKLMANFQGMLILKTRGAVKGVVQTAVNSTERVWRLVSTHNLLESENQFVATDEVVVSISANFQNRKYKVEVPLVRQEKEFDSLAEMKHFLCEELFENEKFAESVSKLIDIQKPTDKVFAVAAILN